MPGHMRKKVRSITTFLFPDTYIYAQYFVSRIATSRGLENRSYYFSERRVFSRGTDDELCNNKKDVMRNISR